MAASMEPCLFRHGKRNPPESCTPNQKASMEPCLFRHGKTIAIIERSGRHVRMLQWSHVFSDMVSSVVSPPEPASRHGSSSARFASMEPCLFRHGKCSECKLEHGEDVVEVLQWSHVFSDMVSIHGAERHRGNRSMEPCLFRHGKIDVQSQSTQVCCSASMEPCLFRHGKIDF
jgi:hypothetical protein